MYRVMLLSAALLMLSPVAQSDEHLPEAETEQDVEFMEAAGLGLNGPSVEDYHRCNRDCKALWSEGLEAERLACVKGCAKVRSLAIMPLPGPPE